MHKELRYTYSNLERELGSIESLKNMTPQVGLIVAMENPNETSVKAIVSNDLELNSTCKEELKNLNSNVITPIGNWTNLLNAVANSKKGDRNNYLSGFMKFFSKKIMDNDLMDKRNIKMLVIYPNLLSKLKPISKDDSTFYRDIIQEIKYLETDTQLRQLIEYSTLLEPRFIERTKNSLIRS